VNLGHPQNQDDLARHALVDLGPLALGLLAPRDPVGKRRREGRSIGQPRPELHPGVPVLVELGGPEAPLRLPGGQGRSPLLVVAEVHQELDAFLAAHVGPEHFDDAQDRLDLAVVHVETVLEDGEDQEENEGPETQEADEEEARVEVRPQRDASDAHYKADPRRAPESHPLLLGFLVLHCRLLERGDERVGGLGQAVGFFLHLLAYAPDPNPKSRGFLRGRPLRAMVAPMRRPGSLGLSRRWGSRRGLADGLGS
jgi:hypothetical protein